MSSSADVAVPQEAACTELPRPAAGAGDAMDTSEPPVQALEPPAAAAAEAAGPPPMSKNALKRLRRQQQWEEGKEDRRTRRKEKRRERKERQREARARGDADAWRKPQQQQQQQAPPPPATAVPVALIVDCGFDEYMSDKERTSLAGQVTRCYSDTRNARYRPHLWLAGWDGPIRERFRRVLGDQQSHWKGVGFVAGDFLACAEQARARMGERGGGEMIAPLQRSLDAHAEADAGDAGDGGDDDDGPPLDARYSDVVYLSAESPHTLHRLEPHTSYVIGGLVDRNREKGLCYRRARARGVRTARLPIAQFMVLQSRRVLATNHVVEIMLRWLECEDWGQAFMAVIPKRKGGRLISCAGGGDEGEGEGGDAGEGGNEGEDGKEGPADADVAAAAAAADAAEPDPSEAAPAEEPRERQ